MENFNYHNPVKILFGKGKVKELRDQLPKDARILMTYGGGSIFKNGIYQQVKEQLDGFEVTEFGGIEANPHFETCMKALPIIKEKNINFLLSVGGGSVLDGTKFIAAGVHYNGAPWEILSKGAKVESALPIGAVLTLPATGSEMNGNSVITKAETQEKLAFSSPLVMPGFSILDPEFTFSLPRRQVANGIVDAFIHVMEQYLTYPVNAPIQDRFAESILLTLIEQGKLALQNEQPDYENRANLMWAATMALNGLIGSGVKTCWATHTIGHELTALHGLDHALTLAIVLPGLLRQLKQKRIEKLNQYAKQVWGISESNKDLAAEKAIEATEDFFRNLGMKTRLSEHNIDEETIAQILNRLKTRNLTILGNQKDITLADVNQLLHSRL
jgi:NADP-dependent alcohol dehydrogenase